jgi:hypothetical protein
VDKQIILLPNSNYWDWVRACRDYVMAYGPNLTADPDMAGRYGAPGQVITFPTATGAYPQAPDMRRWFDQHYPGIRLDAVATAAPEGLEAELRERLSAHDRYGQKRRPFYLVWPTDYQVITQRFGANPQIYSRFGVPAHEGLDIRALTNTNVYSCFDGVVYEVHSSPRDHPYGIHVRILHRDGYRTVYAHLARALVSVGEAVEEGQPIGKADSTGASTGAHLHLTLKRDGATARGETTYPKDIIDPTPFMLWPEGRVRKSSKSPDWVAGRCLLGVCGRAGGPMGEEDFRAVRLARLDAVLLPMEEPASTMRELRAFHPGMLVAVTLHADLSGEPVSPAEFVEGVRADAERWAGNGVVHFQVQANPNLQQEGCRRSWSGGAEFGTWWLDVVARLRQVLPGGSFGFPGLSPGDSVHGQRAHAMDFLLAAETAVQAADWIGVNCFWTECGGAVSAHGIGLVEDYRRLFPDKLLMATEFGNPSEGGTPQDKAREILDFYAAARRVPNLGAVFGYVLSAASGHSGLAWRREEGSMALLEFIGKRPG